MAWMTAHRPTGPRTGTAVLLMGGASVLIASAAVVAHMWIRTTELPAAAVVAIQAVLLLVPLGWGALAFALHRAERREAMRSYAARAGLALVSVTALAASTVMIPGLLNSLLNSLAAVPR